MAGNTINSEILWYGMNNFPTLVTIPLLGEDDLIKRHKTTSWSGNYKKRQNLYFEKE